nr:MAG TPA: hypothetical protein [Caudoviricetes sp.]
MSIKYTYCYMKKIVKGNDFTMKIPVSKYDGE